MAQKEWARGLRFFPEFKKWALSFSHDAAHNLICTLEARLDYINSMAFCIGELIDKYDRYTYRPTSERVALKEINSKTRKFIKELPYISRLQCYDTVCPVLKLTNVEINEKMTN
jgi:hypothetical protein